MRFLDIVYSLLVCGCMVCPDQAPINSEFISHKDNNLYATLAFPEGFWEMASDYCIDTSQYYSAKDYVNFQHALIKTWKQYELPDAQLLEDGCLSADIKIVYKIEKCGNKTSKTIAGCAYYSANPKVIFLDYIFYNSDEIILHEYLHNALWCVYGDGSHDNMFFWSEFLNATINNV